MRARVWLAVVVNLLFITLAIMCLLPFWFMITVASMDSGSLFANLPLLPSAKLLYNFGELMKTFNILRSFGNSVIVAVSSTAMNLFFSTLAGYAFAKHRFRFKEALFGFVFITMFIPGQLQWIGFVQEMKQVGLLDTWWPLILPSLGSAFGIFVMRGYIGEAIPDSLIESAKLDGSGDMRTFFSIVVPLVVPMLASLAILTFMGAWNNFSGALVILYSARKFTLPLTLATIRNLQNIDYPLLCCGLLVSTVPIVAVFLAASNFFIEALTSGAVKG